MIIAKLTDGFLYLDDGAWDYSSLLMKSSNFEKEFPNIGNIKDGLVIDNIFKWLKALKEDSVM